MLLCALLAAASVHAQEPLPRHALVIGNEAYPSGRLDNAASDARLIAQALQDVGFKVTRLENASQEQMLRAVARFQSELEAGKGVGLFYYAGHGVQVRGENFLIPVSSPMRQEEEVRSRGVNAQEIIDRLSAAKNPLNMIFLDACRDDPFARGKRSAAPGLARLDAALGMLIAYSTSPGAVAEDGEGRNSPFAKHLASALKLQGLKVEDVLKRVRTGVREDTRGKQITWDNSAIEGDFYFVPGPATTTSVAAQAPVQVAAVNPSPATAPAPSKSSVRKDVFDGLVKPMTLAELKPGMRFFIDAEADFKPVVHRYKRPEGEDVLRQLHAKVLLFERLEERNTSYGKWTFLLLRLGNELFEIGYSGGTNGALEKVKSSPYRVFQGLVLLDELEQVRKALVGQVLFVMTERWSDESSREQRLHPERRKYVPVTIVDVEMQGATSRKARVVFKDRTANLAYVFADISGTSYVNGEMLDDDLRSLFSTTDPRAGVSGVSADSWRRIERGELRVGMSKEEALLAWGKPLEASKTARENGSFEYWRFMLGRSLMLRNDRVIEINESR
jgi:hypothetical protein